MIDMPQKPALISLVQQLEFSLSASGIDNFNRSNRRMNSRSYHLGTTDLEQAYGEALLDYCVHLTRKKEAIAK